MKPGITLVLNRSLDLSTPSPECRGMIELCKALRLLGVALEDTEKVIYHTGWPGRLLGFELHSWPGINPVFDHWLDQEIGL